MHENQNMINKPATEPHCVPRSACSRPMRHLEMMPDVERLKREYDRVFMMDGRRWGDVRNKLHEYLRAYRAYEKARYEYYHSNA